MRKLEIGLYTGILFGFRTFEPTETHPYWEHHFYLNQKNYSYGKKYISW